MTAPTRTRAVDLALTGLAPATWGTTYLVTTALLPPDRPLTAALLRALPAGLALLALTRRRPTGSWWWRAALLGALNVGAFFPLLFLAAYRLPGGVAATVAAVQPLVVAGLSVPVLRLRPSRPQLLAGVAGVAGVALLTLTAAARLDPLGLLAMLVATCLMGTAIVLAKRWTRGAPPPLVMAGWQLTAGGLLIAPLSLLVEGPPVLPGPASVLGYGYLAVLGGVVSYGLWFRGIPRLPATSVSLLGLGSPLVAALAGLTVLDQRMTAGQWVGFALALAAMVLGARRPAAPRTGEFARVAPRAGATPTGVAPTGVRPTGVAPTGVARHAGAEGPGDPADAQPGGSSTSIRVLPSVFGRT